MFTLIIFTIVLVNTRTVIKISDIPLIIHKSNASFMDHHGIIQKEQEMFYGEQCFEWSLNFNLEHSTKIDFENENGETIFIFKTPSGVNYFHLVVNEFQRYYMSCLIYHSEEITQFCKNSKFYFTHGPRLFEWV